MTFIFIFYTAKSLRRILQGLFQGYYQNTAKGKPKRKDKQSTAAKFKRYNLLRFEHGAYKNWR